MKSFLKGNKLSKESASYMDRVSEHPSEDEEEGAVDQSTQYKGSTTSHDKEPTSESSFSLARSESRMIRYSKAALLVVVCIFATTMGILTYVIVRSSEDAEYHARVSQKLVLFVCMFMSCSIHVFPEFPYIGLQKDVQRSSIAVSLIIQNVHCSLYSIVLFHFDRDQGVRRAQDNPCLQQLGELWCVLDLARP